MSQPNRTPDGGLIDRAKPLSFTFDGQSYVGYAGDTLASALAANGVKLMGRSFKYHRPRGLYSAGFEEPNALVQLRSGAMSEPNIQASRIELFDGLVAESQNRWPCLNFDIGALTGLFGKLFPAGFYYKTFMWPASMWMTYERVIRNIAGMGKTATEKDPDAYAHQYAHCEVLVCGGGPAGIVAARKAAASGARVILVEDGPSLGGTLLNTRAVIDGLDGPEWANGMEADLRAQDNVTVLTRTQAFAYYDHNTVIANERVSDHLPAPAQHQPRQRIWHIRADEVILATGALERPLVFAGNDRPGVMLASAAQALANRFGVKAGARAIVFTNNGSAYTAAADLVKAGIVVAGIVDARTEIPADEQTIAKAAGISIMPGQVVLMADGGKNGVKRVLLGNTPTDAAIHTAPITAEIDCDLVCVSGGWTPSVHLFSQSRGKLRFDDTHACFVPNVSFQKERSVGACAGVFRLKDCLGADHITDAEPDVLPLPLWALPLPEGHSDKRFVDLQNDVTADDVALAHREGFRSVEHLKRYTTLGMGTDQGRTSNVNGLAIMAGHRGEDIPAVGTTTFRPPFSPVTLGAVAGPDVDLQMSPIRRSAMHGWHEKAGAPFVPAGAWKRPQAYPKPGEKLRDGYLREAKHVRHHVGIVDVSTLGKIDVQGKDAAEFLNRLYVNGFAKLEIGKCRYGVMLREDGIVYDDGTVTRIAENRYLVTTTTAHAASALVHMERHAQIVWPELDVKLLSVTEDWAAIAIAGPDSRRVLERVIDGIDLSNDACPFMAYREGTVGGQPVRLFRISFSGELAYEVNIAADYGTALWEALMTAGEEFRIIPYGMEALGILRIEKGHVVSGEINGRTTADDLGFGRMMSKQKRYIGDVLKDRPALIDPDRKQLVGLKPADGVSLIPRGAQLVADENAPRPVRMLGEVTSQCESPNVDSPIGLGILSNGRARMGETLIAASPLTDKHVPVVVCEPVFIDPEGERLRG